MAANQNRPSLQMFEQVFPSLRGAEYSTLKQYLEDGKSVFPLVEKGVPGLVADFGLTPTDAQRFLQRANALAIYVRRQFIEQRLYGADTEVAKPSSGLLSIVEGPSFERLFDVGFNTLCPPDALESVASPVAYLVDLMKWIDRIESVPDEDVKPKMPLNARRTDLARLPIDFNAVHQAVSAVDIILAKLETFIEDHTDGPDDFDVNEAMSTARYPNGLPYYQAWVTLDYVARQNALSVGDVTRAVDQAFPYFLQPEAWAADGGRAMLHASRLGPYQRELLTEDPFDSDDRERFYWLNFGTDARGLDWQNISQVPFFCERTKLEALQLEALLSLRSFAPVRSANALPLDDAPSGAQSGSVYLNAGNTPAVDINFDTEAFLRRLSVLPGKPAPYDRMNRKLRLDQWMGLPPEQVDGLLVAAINAQVRSQTPEHEWWISDHTVQALGLFQELRERYDCTAEDFSVFVDALSIFGRGDMPSQFDRVFNTQTTFQEPLKLDGEAFPVFPVASAEELTIKQLCSGLGIDLKTYSYLALTIAQAHGRGDTLLRNLAIISSFYRLVKLPRMLGMTPIEGLVLLTTLGGETWLKALAGVPQIRQRNPLPVESQPDVLNIIHAMESCVSWCRERELPVLWMVQQVSPIVASATVSANEQQLFEKLRSLLSATLFSDNALLMVGVPPLAGGAVWLDLLTSLVDSNGLVITQWPQDELDYPVFARERLDTAVREGLGEDEAALRAPVVEKMLAVLLQIRAGQVSVVKESLAVYAGVTSELAIPVLTWANGTVYSVLNQALERADDTANGRWWAGENDDRFLALLADVRRRSAVVLKLDLSVELLEDYLAYGYLDWFDGLDKHAFSLRILYYLTVLTRAFGLSEQSSTQLLDYLREVNALPESLTGDALELVRETAAIRLAAFFHWSVQEVRECASRINAQHVIRNLKELDLMLRVRVLATRTHMDAETLFLMGALPATLDTAVYRTAAEHAVLSLYESRVPLIPDGDEALKQSTQVTIAVDRFELVANKAGEKATFTVTVKNTSGRALSGISVNGYTTLGSIQESVATGVNGVATFELSAGGVMGEAIVHFRLPLHERQQAPRSVIIGADKTTLFFPSPLKSPVPTDVVLFGESIELSAVMQDNNKNLGIGMPVRWSSTPDLDIRPSEGLTSAQESAKGLTKVDISSSTGGTFVISVTSVDSGISADFDAITFAGPTSQ